MDWDGLSRASMTAETDAGQKRGPQRHPCRIKTRYRRMVSVGLYRQEEVYLDGWLLNRSTSGVLLETPQFVPEGQVLELSFHTPDDSNAFLAVGTVRWVRKRAAGCFHLGVQFNEVQTF